MSSTPPSKDQFQPPCPLRTPVLFLVYNRPRSTEIVIDGIRKAKPPRLYVAADGPRACSPLETGKVEQARAIATRVDWDCKIKTLFREDNLGCRRAVSGALDWFFDQEEEGIVLEDDCFPSQSFFWYCQDLLEHYRDDERIMAISGNNFQQGRKRSRDSYYFSRYNHCWGWASWQRAWRLYDRDLSLWPQFKQRRYLRDLSGNDPLFESYWTKIFDLSYRNGIDSWAYRWTFTCWAYGGLTCLPSANLVTNIGFGGDATHTRKALRFMDGLPLFDVNFPLIHPKILVRDWQADRRTERTVFRITRLGLVHSRLREAVSGNRFLSRFFRRLRKTFSPHETTYR